MAVDPGNVHHGFFAAAPIPSRLPAQRGRPVESVADEKKKRQTDARRGLLARRVPSCWSKISFLFLPTTSTGGNAPLCQHFPPSTPVEGTKSASLHEHLLTYAVAPVSSPATTPPPDEAMGDIIPHELGEMFIKLGRLPPPTRMLFGLDELDDPRA